MKSLRALTRLIGLQTSYLNDRGEVVKIDDAGLREGIFVLTSQRLNDENDVRAHLALTQTRLRERWTPRTLIAWDGHLHHVQIRVEGELRSATCVYELSGPDFVSHGKWELSRFTPFRSVSESFIFRVPPPAMAIAFGYYQLKITMGEVTQTTFVISAPRTNTLKNQGAGPPTKKKWGLFSPLYALKSKDDWGIGSLRELTEAQHFAGKQGANFFGTLPLLAASGKVEDFDASPYNPTSRLFWNEIYLDIPSIAHELGRADVIENARAMNLTALKDNAYVEHIEVFRLKRKYLEILCSEFYRQNLHQTEAFLKYTTETPVTAYGEFYGDPRYHAFVQFQFHVQLLKNRKEAREGRIADLYLDYPVGVSTSGFDATYFASSFLKGASVGAPPDSFYGDGQNWGTIALNPFELENTKYDYFIRCVRNHVRYASIVRLDHAMSLHRLYIIPDGRKASEGLYVRYPYEVLYAIICLEAHLNESVVVGEDLGTVPPAVRAAMSEHHLRRMWIFEIEYVNNPEKAFAALEERSLISLNTHDMQPFRKFWLEQDSSKKELLMAYLKYLKISMEKMLDAESAFYLLSQKLAQSKAEIFLVNLEDVWGETEAQNTPGVVADTTWKKKNKFALEEWTTNPQFQKFFKDVHAWRRA